MGCKGSAVKSELTPSEQPAKGLIDSYACANGQEAVNLAGEGKVYISKNDVSALAMDLQRLDPAAPPSLLQAGAGPGNAVGAERLVVVG